MVLVDGVAMPSCVLAVARLPLGARIETARSLHACPEGQQLVRTLAAESAVQCGFCVPGILASCVAAWRAGEDLSGEVQARAVLESHICRCSGYNGLVRAITRACTVERHQSELGATNTSVHETLDKTLAAGGNPRGTETARKAAGEPLFVLDRVPEGALYARLLRGRSPHSRVAIDRERLLSMPGIVAVLGPEDDPGILFTANPGGGREDMVVFSAEARFPGDIVGVVIGETREAARAAAADAAGVREWPLPAVLSVAAALAPDAPPAHRAFSDSGNVLGEFAFGCSAEEAHQALGLCEHVFTDTYRCDPTTHAFLEPVAAAVEFAHTGTCHVWSNTQCPVPSRGILSRLLEIPEPKISYQEVALGGSFGGKEEFLLEAVAAMCSREVGGHPVVVETDRREMTAEFRLRHAFTVRVVTGSDAEGLIGVRLIHAIVEGGPYALHTPSVLANGLTLAMAMYPTPVIRATGKCVALNRVPGGAYRGYGAPQVLFAVESQLNKMASELGIDPIELRRINTLLAGDDDPIHGWPVKSYNMLGCLAEAKRINTLQRRTKQSRFRRGRGCAALANISGTSETLRTDRASAECVVRNGRLAVLTAVPDMGQGLHALLAATVANELHISTELIDVVLDSHGKDWGTYASRGAYLTANAVTLAARDLRERIPSEVANFLALPASWEGCRGASTFCAPDNGLVAGFQVADVEVDMATGRVCVLKVTSIHDTGRLLLPDVAREQVVGGVLQGLGNVLLEELPFTADGAPFESTLLALGVPRSMPAVDVEAVFITDLRHPEGPLGAKGVAEAPVVGIAAAVAAAIADATGVWLHETPFTAERVWRAVHHGSVGTRNVHHPGSTR
jgi:CO/xanthine dehydrogenase Mo-binding subunit